VSFWVWMFRDFSHNHFGGTFSTGPYFDALELDLSYNDFTSIQIANYTGPQSSYQLVRLDSLYMPSLYNLWVHVTYLHIFLFLLLQHDSIPFNMSNSKKYFYYFLCLLSSQGVFLAINFVLCPQTTSYLLFRCIRLYIFYTMYSCFSHFPKLIYFL